MTKPIFKTSAVILTIFLMAFSCNDEGEDSADCVCIEIFDPVCGSDGQVYSNSCFAECAGVEYVDCKVSSDAIILNTGSIAADGCDWVIQIDGINHHPLELSNEFLTDSLEVEVIFFDRPDETFSCGMLPAILPVIEVFDISEK
ncbi:MAG: Kazal-type serine protease inhibitor domain-containing protein [Bacteroidota bacterium]